MQFLEKLWKMWESTDIKLVTTERRRKYMVSELNYTINLLAIEMIKQKNKKTDILMNKPVYLGLSILELSKILMYKLIWLCKMKIWWKSEIMLYGYRQFHCIHKNRWYS